MIKRLLGLPLEMAEKELAGKEYTVAVTYPPRKPDKTGNMRVVRVKECGGTVQLTVSPFHDTLEDAAHDEPARTC